MATDLKYIFQLGELFERVQMEKIYPDSKTFVDCIPKEGLTYIHDRYEEEKTSHNFNLEKFVHKYFDQPPSFHTGFTTKKNVSLSSHIQNLWDVLTRKTEETNNSLIPLPNPYVVPGGRFREMFYWDSYFTMLGLQISKREDLISDMIGNFYYQVENLGYIPNGNRTYFLGRSQPPFLSFMLDLLSKESDHSHRQKQLDILIKEYDFWMNGKDTLNLEIPAAHRVAMLPDGSVLNHYWDENITPRPEAYRKDMEWAKGVSDTKTFFRNERAACESGWDFSSRWFEDGKDIHTMRAANLISIDLNALIYHMEKKISAIAEETGKRATKEKFETFAAKRKKAVDQYCWDEDQGCYFDYDYVKKSPSNELTIAIAAPLFVQMSSQQQADAVAKILEQKFLKQGGFLTTLKVTGQQWDAPNGWAPLEWMAIKGLYNYGHKELAVEGAKRWMKTNETIFDQTGKMMEKYNVEHSAGDAEAGTYPTQDGFGWTNGVYLACRQLVEVK